MSRSPLNYRDYIVDYINSDVSNYEGIMLNTSELNDIATYLEELDRARDTIDELRNKMDDIVEKLEEMKTDRNCNLSCMRFACGMCDNFDKAIEIVKGSDAG